MDWQMFLFSTDGRINRGKYWLAALLYLVVSFVTMLLGLFIITGTGSDTAAVVLYVGGGMVFLSIYFSGITVAIKRLHDRDKTGWWCVLFLVLPGLLYGASTGIVSELTGLVLSLLAGVLGVWGFVELGCLRGTMGPNRFGPDPLAAEGAV